MKILLVRPPVPKHTIGLKHIMICEPLELEYIAADLLNHQVVIFDYLVESNFKKRFKQFKPDIVVSSCYKTGTNEVIKLFRKIKIWDINCITIAGGVHATLNSEDFIDVAVDIIAVGDGTFLLAEIVNTLDRKENILNVSNLAIPIGEGSLIKSKSSAYMPHPDDLPLPRRDLVKHLLPKYYYLMHKPVATIKTTWGCWYECNFCFTWKITKGSTFSRSPESIVKELLTLEAKEVYIVDDIFLINKSRLRKLADLIVQHNIKKNYLCYARADFIVENEDVIEEWATLGLTAVFVGLEAVTEAELDHMAKDTPVHYNYKAVEILNKYKIDTYGSLIPGPEYEQEDWDRLWDFIEATKLYYVNISPATPLPGAKNYEEIKDQLTVPEDAHGLFDLSHQILPTKMPLKDYYRQLLRLYSRTILNLRRANNYTHRTLPSIWDISYWRMILGSLKIGWQFMNAHKHHSKKEIAIARNKGEKVENLTFQTKMSHPSFQSLVSNGFDTKIS